MVDLGPLGLDRGGHLLVKRALHAVPVGSVVHVRGDHPELALHLTTWCRGQGHGCQALPDGTLAVTRGGAYEGRWRGSERSGPAIAEVAPAHWGLAPRGAAVEAGGPRFAFPLATKAEVCRSVAWRGPARSR